MEPIYDQNFYIDDGMSDRYGRLKASAVLTIIQEASGHHSDLLKVDRETLGRHELFFAVSRHRVQISRIPRLGETLRVETWPMPTTRVAYPRSVVAYDEEGQECFRSISLWVLIDKNTRNMITPGKSGIVVSGTLRGNELAVPGSLCPAEGRNLGCRSVCFTDLDPNGHMNNARCLDWISDLLPSIFHKEHPIKELTICYLSEALEGEALDLYWDFKQENLAQVDAYRHNHEDGHSRVFSVKIQFS